MRKSLAIFGLFLFALSPSVFAATPGQPYSDIGAYQATYPDCTNSPSSDLGAAAADQVICSSQAKEYCRLAGDTPNCPSGSNSHMPTTNYFTASPDPTGAAATNAAVDEVQKLLTSATDSCQLTTTPQASATPPSTTTPPTGSPTTPGARGGIPGAAAQNSEMHTSLMQSQGQQTGVCRARKDFCVNRANQVANDAHQANNSDAETKVKALADQCNALTNVERTMTTAAQQSGQAAQQAKEAEKHASSDDPKNPGKDPSKDPSKDPATNPGGGSPGSMTPQSTTGTGSGNKDSSGGGLGNMAGLMQAMQAMNQQQPQTTPTTPTEPQSMDCGASVVGGKCGGGAPAAAAAQPWPKGNGGASLEAQSKEGASGFNPQSTSDSMIGSNLNQLGTSQPAKPGSAQPVANGGGQMLGGGGGGSGGASLAASGGGAYQARQQQVAYNLGDAHGGGGYSQTAASMNTAAGGTGGWSGYGRDPASENIDLNQFLPGGKRDPTRGPAGLNGKNLQIQAKEVNIWTRISDHIRSRCSQGLLRDCVP